MCEEEVEVGTGGLRRSRSSVGSRSGIRLNYLSADRHRELHRARLLSVYHSMWRVKSRVSSNWYRCGGARLHIPTSRVTNTHNASDDLLIRVGLSAGKYSGKAKGKLLPCMRLVICFILPLGNFLGNLNYFVYLNADSYLRLKIFYFFAIKYKMSLFSFFSRSKSTRSTLANKSWLLYCIESPG